MNILETEKPITPQPISGPEPAVIWLSIRRYKGTTFWCVLGAQSKEEAISQLTLYGKDDVDHRIASITVPSPTFEQLAREEAESSAPRLSLS